MARIKRIYFNDVLTYPMTITDAIIDNDTQKILTVRLRELESVSQTGVISIDAEDIKKIINGQDISNQFFGISALAYKKKLIHVRIVYNVKKT